LVQSVKVLLVDLLPVILVYSESIVHRHKGVQSRSDKGAGIRTPLKVPTRVVRAEAQALSLLLWVLDDAVIIKRHLSRQIAKAAAPQKATIRTEANQIASVFANISHVVAFMIKNGYFLRVIVNHHKLLSIGMPLYILQLALLRNGNANRRRITRR